MWWRMKKKKINRYHSITMRLGTLYRDISLKDISYTEVDIIKIDILIRRALKDYITTAKIKEESLKNNDWNLETIINTKPN